MSSTEEPKDFCANNDCAHCNNPNCTCTCHAPSTALNEQRLIEMRHTINMNEPLRQYLLNFDIDVRALLEHVDHLQARLEWVNSANQQFTQAVIDAAKIIIALRQDLENERASRVSRQMGIEQFRERLLERVREKIALWAKEGATGPASAAMFMADLIERFPIKENDELKENKDD